MQCATLTRTHRSSRLYRNGFTSKLPIISFRSAATFRPVIAHDPSVSRETLPPSLRSHDLNQPGYFSWEFSVSSSARRCKLVLQFVRRNRDVVGAKVTASL